MKAKQKYSMLDYRLTDTLEMTYSKNRKKVTAVKNRLLSRSIKDATLYALPSFILEDALVVIQDGDLKQVKQLYLLDAHRQSFKTFEI